jgi:hypothetical protein
MKTMASSSAGNQAQQAEQGKGPVLTKYAKKYGLAKEPWLRRIGKSGLSPINLGFLKDFLPAETFSLYSRAVMYQQWNISVFTSQILLQWGAIESENVKPSDLTWIHPIYTRDKWLNKLPAHRPAIPLGHGLPGEYTAQNPVVWKVLVPVLALASQFIANSHLWAW